MNLRQIMDGYEKRVLAASISPYASLALAIYGVAWFVFERGNIGWDGVLTLIAAEIALSTLRGRRSL